MSGIAIASGGAMAIPSASMLKFVTIGNSGLPEYGFRGPPHSVPSQFGSIQLTDRILGKQVTMFRYNPAGPGSFVFEIDETNSAGFDFTSLLVENVGGTFDTFLKSAAVPYSGFPLAGWIWTTAPFSMWTLASVGTVKRIYVRR